MARALVIGSGFGGIASALRLRALGLDVHLIEHLDTVGGRAQVFEHGGYRHDAGPTVITAPFLFDELFELFGETREHHIEFRELTPWYRFLFPDGDHFDYGGSLADTLTEIARIEPKDCKGYESLVKQSKAIFNVGFSKLAHEPFHKFSNMVKQIPALLKLRSDRTVWNLVCHHLSNDKLRQAFSIQPLLVGGSPFDTTSIYGLIHYLERAYGIYFAMGGTGALVKALEELMGRHGITIQTGATVSEMIVEKRRILGVRLENGDALYADHVVYNGDPMHLYHELIPNHSLPLSTRVKRDNAKLSMGLYVLFFGTDCKYTDVAHHTIWMGQRYRELLDDIFHRQILADDFSLYIHRPTATDPSFAPAGHDSFYILAPVPHQGANIDWHVEEPKLRERILDALDRTMLPGLKSHIQAPFAMTPDDFSEDYLSYKGSGFSIAPLFSQSAWFRFHNKAEGFENLYLAGAGTHPGAGMPGVISSAKIVERLVQESLTRETTQVNP
ncbi:phytoene desaturase family protein [Litorivicinus sp.]|jgi:phytoene desaturase|nr:phytoene desaturase family protein [Litorivicinus sp.]MDB9862729.1 phytoene desaturase family protein [Litorivicinus sp.]MDC1239853.1 phytoene desaturase family protein [Litorivicinus sp.]